MFLGINISLVGRLKAGLSAYAVGAFEPDLVFDFANEYYRTGGSQTTFDSAMTHSRSGNATMVDSDGLLKWAPHNLLTYSENINDCFPNKDSVSVSGSQVTANSGTGAKALRRNVTDITSRESRTVRAKITAGTHDYAYITIRGAFRRWLSAVFDLSNGTVSEEATDGAAIEAASISPDGDGYICVIKGYVLTDGSENIKIGLAESATGNTFNVSEGSVEWQSAALGTETIFVTEVASYRSDLGGMVNNPDRGDSYVPTTSSAVYLPRRGHHVYNGTSWVNEGLLVESEARTNLVTYSQDFTTTWTSNNATLTSADATGPDGATSMTLLNDDSGTGTGEVYVDWAATVSTSTTYTFSIFAKADQLSWIALGTENFTTPANGETFFDLSTGTVGTEATGHTATIENYGGGIYRVAITFTTDGTDTTGNLRVYVADADTDITVDRDGTSSIHIYGAQFE